MIPFHFTPFPTCSPLDQDSWPLPSFDHPNSFISPFISYKIGALFIRLPSFPLLSWALSAQHRIPTPTPTCLMKAADQELQEAIRQSLAAMEVRIILIAY